MKRWLVFAISAPLFTLACMSEKSLFAQSKTAFNEIRFLTMQQGFGAKALGMGGAFIGVANDYSSLYWNPGGLAFNKQFELYGSISSDRTNNRASVFNTLTEVDQSFTRLNSFGMLAPVPVRRGGFSLGVGINRVAAYNNVLAIDGFNDAPDDRVRQHEDVSEEGGIHTGTIAGGIEVAKGVGVGAAINFCFGSHQYNSLFTEYDDLNLYTLDEYRNEQVVDSRIRGVDVTVGVLFRPSRYARIGVTLTTPQYFWVTEEYEVNEDYYYDKDANLKDELYTDDGVFDYDVVLPYRFGFGMAYVTRFITFGGAVEYRDWSQSRYLSEPPTSGLSKVSANRDIRQTVRAVLTQRIGMELKLGLLPAALRAGFSHIPSPFKNAAAKSAQKSVSFGAHVGLAKNVFFDVTYLYDWWNGETVDEQITTPVMEKRSENKVLAGITVRF